MTQSAATQPDSPVDATDGPVARSTVVTNRYRDSVALMRMAAAAAEIGGVQSVAVVMATEANLLDAATKGFAVDSDSLGVTPTANDVFIGVIGEDRACALALAVVSEDLAGSRASTPAAGTSGGSQTEAAASISSAFQRAGGSAEAHSSLDGGLVSVAVISVPAAFAASEARKALALGMHVMLFSDNVGLDDECDLKQLAAQRGLLLMGPDCGTAMINGVPLGFANVVRRGSVTVIGASGTGMQEVMAHLHRLGSGVRQAIGCGGRDLHLRVGGSTMIQALRLAQADGDVEAVVLVSKPPDPAVLRAVAEAARPLIARGVPVILSATGLHSGDLAETGLHVADSLDDAARIASRLASAAPGGSLATTTTSVPLTTAGAPFVLPGRGETSVVGAFSGGTLKTEFTHLLRDLPANVSVHAVDFGDDEYTKGRPHPMIDPGVRDREVIRAMSDPAVAVVHFDVVLGFGAASDPIGGLLSQLAVMPASRSTLLCAHVLGTELDPQGRDGIVRRLTDAGVNVFDTNAQAANFIRSAVTGPEREGHGS